MRFLVASILLWAALGSSVVIPTKSCAQDVSNQGAGGGGVVFGGAPSSMGMPQPAGPVDISAEIRRLRQPHRSAGVQRRDGEVEEAVHAPVAATSVSAETVKISQLLSQKNTFEFNDTPLSDVADWLKTQLECNIVFDEQALEDEAIDKTSDGVTFDAKGMSYRSALFHLLHDLNLTYMIENEVLMITSQEKAEESLQTRVYPVWDLAKPAQVDEGTKPDCDTLIEVITTTISPNSWDDVGGPGSINAYKGMITIRSTYAIHSDIAKLLDGLRMFPRLTHVVGPHAKVGVIDLSRSNSKDTAAKLLSKSMSFQFADTPLVDVASWILEQSPINVLFDRRALEDESIDPSADTITIDVVDVSLRAALDLMLLDLNLTYVVDHEAIVITSQETAEETLRTKVYQCDAVIDLADKNDLPYLRDELDQLSDTISSTVSVSSWDEVGGPGSIAPFPARGLLVIAQTDKVHGKVEGLLNQLRRGRASKNAAPRQRFLDPSEITVRSYNLSRDFANKESQMQLIGLIEGLLQDSDNAVNSPATDFAFEGLSGRLVVSHRRDAQEPIRRMLEKLNALDRPAVGTGGMLNRPGGTGHHSVQGGMF